MSKSRRRRIITIGGLIATVAIWFLIQPSELRENEPRGEGAAQGEQAAPPYEGSVVCERDCQVTFGIDEAAGVSSGNDGSGKGSAKQSDQEYRLTQYDLRAQERMAWWTILIAMFTGVGVFFLAETLDETANATRYASEAADLARQTLNGDRAWLLVGDVDTGANNEIDAQGNRIRPDFFFNIRLNNSGRTPAINVRIRRQFFVLPRPFDPETIRIRDDVEWSATVPLGTGQLTSIHWFRVRTDDLRLVRNGTHRILLMVEVLYNDIFTKAEHRTHACVEILVVAPFDHLLRENVPRDALQFPAVGVNEAT